MLPTLVCAISLLSLIHGYPWFQTRIPNGQQVPNPCKSGSRMWSGVGHLDSVGSGQRNVFGLDFFQAGERWTVNLCEMDSDHDGKTNGEELGDPKCEWYVNGPPIKTNATGHPGICEPMHSPKCLAVNRGIIYCSHGIS